MFLTERFSFRDSRLRTYSFYIFMITCGFIAGTRIWLFYRQDMIHTLILDSCCTFLDYFKVLFIPAAAAFGLTTILAFFAGGWLLIPVCAYAFGGGFGVLCCEVFSSKFDFVDAAFCISYYLAIIVVSFECVGSHYMSRQLSGFDGQRVISYSQHMMGTAALLTVVAAVCAAFSGLIYFVVYR